MTDRVPDVADRLLPAAPHNPLGALGAHWDGHGTAFAVFAQDAERVELCLFDAEDRGETARLAMPECVDGVWRGYLPNARPSQRYGYRVSGPYDPKRGHRFNPHKLLLDPCARQLAGELRWHDALYGYRYGSPRGDLSFDPRDSAAYMPKAVICDDHFDWGDDRAPRTPWPETVIYELHVRGFTMRREDIPERERGTFGALAHPGNLEHLKRLGVTAVELMPVHAFISERALLARGRSNYWGYNPLAWSAPHAAYLCDGAPSEFKRAVRQIHAAGLEVILDVVYNHTCESDENGPTLSWRGFGNAAWYRLRPDEPRRTVDVTGCGNTVNTSHPRVIQVILESLRHWVSEYHLDGFRFDLGATLGRGGNGFESGSGFFEALMADPVLSRVKLIVEPWDCGADGYRLGRHPAGMGEWNGKFRDEVRRFWRGDAHARAALAGRLQGSADLFDQRGRRPWASVNYVAAHDGFTLNDWASYETRHNEANGENNRDGPGESFSRNWGVEGTTGDSTINDTRARIRRAMLATLLCSHGTPMLLGGDEFGRTQDGNSNAYCHDSGLSWLDWGLAESGVGRELQDFVAGLIRLRRELFTLRSASFQHGHAEIVPGVRDIEWFGETGAPMTTGDWHDNEARRLAVRRAARLEAAPASARAEARAEVSLMLINNSRESAVFALPLPALRWDLRLDSACPTQPDPADRVVQGGGVEVAAHSVQLLVAFADIPS